jgi:hypothetical protein
MDLEQVERKMLWTKIQRLLNISLPTGECLAGQSCD